jgi:hypothetical protein
MNSSNTDSNVLAPGGAVRYTSNTRSIERLFDRTPDPQRSTAMSVAFAEPVLDRPAALARPASGGSPRVRTRPRRPGPGVGPAARPRQVRFSAPPVAQPQARACGAAPVVARPRSRSQSRSWHLTDRGLAVVLVLAAALVAASIVVVGLTALRVTGEGYRPAHSAAAPVLTRS